MTRKQRRGILIGTCLVVLGVAVGLVLYAHAGFDRVLLYAERGRRDADLAGAALQARRTGRDGKRGARRGHDHPLRRHRQDRAPCRSPLRACCPTCSARARAWWPKACSGPTAPSRPTTCSPSTTRNTCRRRWQKLKEEGVWRGEAEADTERSRQGELRSEGRGR